MNVNPEVRTPKFVLGTAELGILSMLTKTASKEEILSYLLKNGTVTSKSSGEKALESLQEKGFVSIDKKEIKATEAGKLLQKALAITKVLSIEVPEQKGGKE
jgi:hypothetical protein